MWIVSLRYQMPLLPSKQQLQQQHKKTLQNTGKKDTSAVKQTCTQTGIAYDQMAKRSDALFANVLSASFLS